MAEHLEDDDEPRKRPGRRCDVGCESWPDDDDYNPCPKCGLPTERYTNLVPLSDEEAFAIKNQIDFDEFYESEWPKRRDEWRAANPAEAA